MTGSVYSVGQVNSYIKNMFAQDFLLSRIYVRGEVSDCKYHTSGHIYFTLKDESGVLQAIMFKGSVASGLKFRMKRGDNVIVLGAVRVFEKNGAYQLYAQEILLEGAGVLYRRFEELKSELEEMGMFAPEYKKPIPRYARRIGVVTAPTGAAVRDIQNIARRRNPFVQLILYPARVQGEGAAASIIEGLTALDELGVDVIIVGRGGGSIEDLWAFNEEEVARAIFASGTPVISAVGHETDTTIADFVADLRAPTPSAAAELAVFDYRGFENQLRELQVSMNRLMSARLEREENRLKGRRLLLERRKPETVLLERRQLLADAGDCMERCLTERLAEKRRLTEDAPICMAHRMELLLKERRHRLELAAAALDGLSPLKRLGGGYAFLTDSSGRRIESAAQVSAGDVIRAQLQDGCLYAEVRETERNGTDGA